MNKAEFIDAIVKSGKYGKKSEAARAYDAVVCSMTGRLSKGGATERVIRLPELGTFQMKVRKARMGKNPQTGATIKIAAKKVVGFKAGKSLLKSL
ncbi:MAG TPA: HU family DNA-binding protein [Candidatus Omnitrophota bacterium]|nr:HU family DNA-binding protein [Candidatus Omnitrophota bacterium]HPS19681.1 HU family DNA-binding protein [Candidatus Omnitrophota bacterium]